MSRLCDRDDWTCDGFPRGRMYQQQMKIRAGFAMAPLPAPALPLAGVARDHEDHDRCGNGASAGPGTAARRPALAFGREDSRQRQSDSITRPHCPGAGEPRLQPVRQQGSPRTGEGLRRGCHLESSMVMGRNRSGLPEQCRARSREEARWMPGSSPESRSIVARATPTSAAWSSRNACCPSACGSRRTTSSSDTWTI